MKFNDVIIGSDAYPRLAGQTPTQSSTTTTNNALEIHTGSGYIRIGPQNTSHCHFITDRSNYYFDKKIMVNTGIVTSYDEDLVLRRADNSSHQMVIDTTEVSTPLHLDVEGNIEFTSHSHQLRSQGTQNAELRTGAGSAGGLLLRNTSGSFLAQLYGDGTNYGFLDGVWSGWDIQKVTNGKLYLNGSTTYFLQPEAGDSAKFFRYVQIGDSSSYNSNTGTWGARLNVTDDVHAKIEVGQDADGMLSHWYAHTGQTSIKFGTSSAHNVDLQRAGSTQVQLQSGGTLFYAPIRRNSHHASGFLEGSYNNIGANGSKSNPIYTIGSSYNPTESALSNMYGIGFCNGSQASFISMGGASSWGMYVASGGAARIFLDGSNGHISTTGEHYSGNGEAAAPSHSFINDTNTGMYRYTTDQIGFATAGIHRMSIDSTGLRLSTGAYIAPSSAETTDLKSATSTNYLRFKNSSNTIHGGVYGSGTDIGLLDKDGNWAIRHIGDSQTVFYINNSERAHIDNDGIDIVHGSLMMSGEKVISEKIYSGTSNIGTSGAWYTLCYITEHSVPVYINLKYAAHSTQTFVVTTGYHGSNVASIQMLSGTYTQNGGYPGASAVRILKDSSNNYRFQLQLTYSSGPTSFSLYARVWGGTPEADVVSLQSSLTVDTTTGSTIDSLNTGFTGSASSRSHRAASGSNSLPSYTFHEDSNTGMYRDTSDSIGFATNGTQRVTISNSGLDVKSSGTVKINGTNVIDASRNVFPANLHFGGATNQSFINGGSNIQIYGDNVIKFSTYAGSWVERAEVGDSQTKFYHNLMIIPSGWGSPNNHAAINIGRAGSGETRAIDINGSWSSGEHKSISFTHGTSTSNNVAQIRVTHQNPGSKIEFGRFYHSGDSSSYPVRIESSSQTTVNMSVDGRLKVLGSSANWGETTPGTTLGSIHLDPENATDHYGSAITWGASDTGDGNSAQAGIYVRSDGNYGTKMYLATTNNYGTGSQTSIKIDHSGHVTISRGNLYSSYRTYIGDGSLAAPAYSFSNDSDTGMWRNSNNQINFAAGGVDALQINNNREIVIGGNFSNNHYNSVSRTRLSFGGGNDFDNYFIGTTMENYGGNYTKLDLRWHTGIRMGAQASYGGIRFFNNEDLATVLFSIGKGDTTTRVENGGLELGSGVNLAAVDGHTTLKRTNGAPLILDRLGTTGSGGTSRDEIINFRSNGTKVGEIGYQNPYGGILYISHGNTAGFGIGFYQFSTSRYIQPCDQNGGIRDDQVDIGSSASRFDDVYATNGTIQTSDRNEKQDIQALTTAEQAAAVACKSLVRRFRWIDSVEEKGDNARYHFGVIAQDVEAAFTAQGLDAGRYGLFIRTNWWEHENTWYPSEEAAPAGAVEKTRLGIRYNQLLAFIISAL